ncbi:MAG: hypothetical protein BMS9Abin02_2086 [Anaerolineae bacterium]|nr:MAG: hypothetical protein BMS9Abin02_2086 [Anaerolineae bacterium]
MSDQKLTQRKDSNKGITPKPHSEDIDEQVLSSQLPLAHLQGVSPELPNLPNTLTLRRQLVQRLQTRLGNSAVARRMSSADTRAIPAMGPAPPDLLQRDGEDEQEGEGASETTAAASGAGSIQNATEDFYDISGAALNDITGQLAHFDGQYGAQTETQLGISTAQMQVERQADRSVRVEVPWSINSAVVGLPRWTDYANACAAAQQEWNRFMRRARQHEQEAHVDMAYQFVRDLGLEDRIVSGRNAAALRRNLAAKQRALIRRLTTIHDGCDHGVSIDAILHPDNGRCA